MKKLSIVLVLASVLGGCKNNENRSDGFFFESEETGKLIEINADCVISQK